MEIKFKYLILFSLLMMFANSCKTIDNNFQDSDGDGVLDNKDRCPLVKGDINNYGCPNNLKSKYTDCHYTSVQYDSSGLTASKEELIRKECLFQAIKNSGDEFLLVGHYFDSINSKKSYQLSYQRANKLKLYIVKRYKVSPSKIQVKGKGDRQPISTLNSENNRVEIKNLSHR